MRGAIVIEILVQEIKLRLLTLKRELKVLFETEVPMENAEAQKHLDKIKDKLSREEELADLLNIVIKLLHKEN